VHPVFFGSAITGAGVAELTSGIVALLPTAGGDADAELSGSVFKIERGPDGQKVALIPMFNGSLRIRDRMCFGRAEDRVTRISVVGRGAAGTSAEAVAAGRIARVWAGSWPGSGCGSSPALAAAASRTPATGSCSAPCRRRSSPR
jgi:ribosomal protection tetracycline resistance protein